MPALRTDGEVFVLDLGDTENRFNPGSLAEIDTLRCGDVHAARIDREPRLLTPQTQENGGAGSAPQLRASQCDWLALLVGQRAPVHVHYQHAGLRP